MSATGVINGIGGTVTLANGYTAKVQGWKMDSGAVPQVERILNAAGNWVHVDSGCPHYASRMSWACELEATCAMAVTGIYIANPSGWSVLTACDADPYFVMDDQFQHVTAGYRSGSWEVRGLQDRSYEPPGVGDVVSAGFEQSAGVTYAGSSMVTGISEEDGLGTRAEIVTGAFIYGCTAVTLPIAGVMGVLTLTNGASVVFEGNVLITATAVALDRGESAPSGKVVCSAVGDGAWTGYSAPTSPEDYDDAAMVSEDNLTADNS